MTQSYPTFRQNAQRRPETPCELRPPLKTVWYEEVGFRPTHPVVADGRVYVVRRDGKTVAKTEKGGEILWVSKTRGSPVTAHRGRLILHGNRIALLDGGSGRVRGAIAGPGALEGACIDDVFLARSHDRGSSLIFAASLDDGHLLWEHRLPEIPSDPDSARLWISSSFGATSDRVVFGIHDGTVVALGLRDGKELWRTSVADLGWQHVTDGWQDGEVVGAVVIYGDTAILEILGGHVAAVRLSDGKRVWTWRQAGLGEGYLYGDLYYVIGGRALVWAIDPRRGKTVSRVDLYESMPKNVQMRIGELCTPFLVSETHFFAGSTFGYVSAFDRKDGRFVWTGRPRNGSCTYYRNNYFMAVNGQLYYSDQSFGIHCLEGASPARGGSRTRRG